MNKQIKRYLFLILICSFFNKIVYGQQLEFHRLFPPNSKKKSDLQFLKDELKNKRLVMLGEMTHAYSNIFEMKIRVIEYLHKEMGFSTIAMESSMYDLWLMNKRGFNKKDFNDAIWAVWSDSKEFQNLVNYIETNNIKVIGFDSQFNNNIQNFIDEFFDYCENKKITIEQNKTDMGIIIEGVLENNMYDNSDLKFSDFEIQLTKIINKIKKLKGLSENDYYWLQFIKNVLACAKDAFYSKIEIPTLYYATKQHNHRDRQMADNLLFYLERNREEKIICWADNIHIVNSMSSIKDSIIKDFIPMGSYIKKTLKSQVYSLATLHGNDSIFIKGKWYPTPIKKDSFEHELLKTNFPYLYISSNQNGMQSNREHRLLGFKDFIYGNPSNLYDGYIFLERAVIPKEGLKSYGKTKASDLTFKLNTYSDKARHFNIKGKVVDSTNEEAVPYASLILKEPNIYRVADEKGNFSILVDKLTLLNDSLEVSSMGFVTKKIPLSAIANKISLDPSFEKLDEVRISARIPPSKILAKAINRISENHPVEPFNSKRYTHSVRSFNDSLVSDNEYVTKEYNQGYRQSYISTRKYEQIRRNLKSRNKKSKKWLVNSTGRENAIQYCNILHKRKFKKFDVQYEIFKDIKEKENFYIISFNVDRDKWNYTNRAYPTSYSGKIFIEKKSFAILKIIQNWETTLDSKEIEKYKFWLGENIINNNYSEIKLKEEIINTYSKQTESKYFANTIFKRIYCETIDKNGIKENSLHESSSCFFDVNTTTVEEISHRKNNILNKLKYNSNFWKSFDKGNYIKKCLD